MKRASLRIIGVVSLLWATATSAQPPDFSGTWQLDRAALGSEAGKTGGSSDISLEGKQTDSALTSEPLENGKPVMARGKPQRMAIHFDGTEFTPEVERRRVEERC
jgi:hypothetical protein